MKFMKKSILSVSTLLLLAACGGNKASENAKDVDTDDKVEQTEKNQTDSSSSTTSTQEVNLADTEFSVSMSDAVEIFNKEFTDAQIESIELDDENGQYYYEIEAHDGRDLKIDAQTGDVVKKDEVKDDDQDDQVINPSEAITPKEAMNKALEVAGADAFVESWSLSYDDDHQAMVYEIDFRDVDDVVVNATNGEILPD